MAIVEGIGGVFIDSRHARVLADWYREHLAIPFEEHPDGGSYFKVFRTRDVATGDVRENPVLAINQTEAQLAGPEQRGLIINLRVDDLDALLKELAAGGVQVEERTIEWEGGKHGWMRDLDGNRIELCEELPLAPDSPYHSS